MEPRRGQAHKYMSVGIQLIFLGFCVTPSVNTKVVRCYSNGVPNDSSTTSLPCYGMYLMKSYLGKYDSSLDSDFRDFMTQKLLTASCGLLPDYMNDVLRPSVSKRYLIGEGSHRRLFTSIRFNSHPVSLSEQLTEQCEVLFIERLPSGVFADPFELQHLVQRGVFADAAVFGDTNLELPSFLSNQTVVEVHMDIDRTALSSHENGLDINIELPLHSRYPSLEESGYSIVEFPEPDIFIRCSIGGKSHDNGCFSTLINDDSASKISDITWKIPSGIKAHTRAVSILTFLSALLSTCLIVFTSVCSPHVKIGKILSSS